MPGPSTWRRLRRSRRVALAYWAAALTLALVSATAIGRSADRADAARRAWGETRSVAVVVRPVDTGAVIDASDVSMQDRPLVALPEGALGRSPAGQVALTALVTGEVLIGARVAPAGLRGVAALVPPGWRALSVPGPSAGAGLALAVGDRVDALATFATSGSPPEHRTAGSPTVIVASDVLVVDVGDAGVTLAVPAADAPRLAFAVASAAVSLALRGA